MERMEKEMSDCRTWYLFGQALRRQLEKRTTVKSNWLKCMKDLAENEDIHDKDVKSFKEDEKLWDSYYQGYLAAMKDAHNAIMGLYHAMGKDDEEDEG